MSTNTNVARIPSAIPALQMNEAELSGVLQTSLYPGAALPSIKMVIEYCRAANLDPMQKPVHIVPMWDKKLGDMRDVIMPGIGLYRTQAARSGEYAGVSEPEFGEEITETLGGQSITYPKSCRVTVKRLLSNGSVVEFSAVELWKENYATAKRDSLAPNAMWARRPFAQLAKCAEAQALRKAFPEFGSQPTSDEMEGKEIYVGEAPGPAHGKGNPPPAALPDYTEEQFKKNVSVWQSAIEGGKQTPDRLIAMISASYTLSEDQKRKIHKLRPIDAGNAGQGESQ